MRGLCGWFSTRPNAEAAQTLQRMRDANRMPTPAPQSELLSGAALSTFGAAAPPRLLRSDGFVLAAVGHPRLRDGSSTAEPLVEVARALRERGRDALASIGGDFALACWDENRARGLLAIDRIGVHPLVYARQGDALAFASTLDMLAGYPGITRELSPQAIYDYLYYHVCPGPETVYRGLMRLPPGHCIEWGQGAPAAPQPYWSMRFIETNPAQLQALEREFIGLLETSVREASERSSCGAFLSGGTDSSTVSGMLGRVSGAPARTFSMGFDAAGFDETEYARIAARHFHTDHHEYVVKPEDVVAALPTIAASYDQPFGNASAVPTFLCARFARDNGVSRLLAGDGGDELFGGNERYAKQHIFALYQHVPAALRRGVLEPLLFSLPGIGSVPPLRKLRSYVEQARPPMPLRYESYNLLQHLGPSQVLTPDFLAAVDMQHPHSLMQQAFAPFEQATLINQMLAIDLRFILADGDLPKVTHMCDLADVDVAFPLLDDRLIEFSAHLPPDMKLRGTRLRWFFKHALRDFLPREIITKKKHGFGLPVGHWLVHHQPLHDMAVDAIERLRPRGIVRPEFVRQLLDVKLREHEGFYGVMVWVLMVLGLWLDSRKL